MIIEGWVLTVASVGDSRCTLESSEGGIYYLSADHRLESNEEEYVVLLLQYDFIPPTLVIIIVLEILECF